MASLTRKGHPFQRQKKGANRDGGNLQLATGRISSLKEKKKILVKKRSAPGKRGKLLQVTRRPDGIYVLDEGNRATKKKESSQQQKREMIRGNGALRHGNEIRRVSSMKKKIRGLEEFNTPKQQGIGREVSRRKKGIACVDLEES